MSTLSDRAHTLMNSVTYKDSWVPQIGTEQGRVYLRWVFYGKCAESAEPGWQQCRKWWLSSAMTDGEIAQTAFMAALAAEEHECREFFKYKDKRIFGPHISVDALLEIADRTEVRQYAGK